VTSSGDLHIKSAQSSDGDANYSCLTLHSLTGERRRSSPATLMVTGETTSYVSSPACAVRVCRLGVAVTALSNLATFTVTNIIFYTAYLFFCPSM
jgi:hypothetical protein